MPMFILKIKKSYGGRNPRNTWVNDYVFNSEIPLEHPDWVALVEAVAQSEKDLHLNQVHFMSAIVSTFNEEPNYQFSQLRTFTLQGTGGFNAENAIAQFLDDSLDVPSFVAQWTADLNFCLVMNKNATLGRTGKMYYRGCLLNTEMRVDSYGQPTLSPDGLGRFSPVTMANYNSRIMNMAQSGFTWVIPPTEREAEAGGNLVVRNVMGAQVGGVALVPRNHKWFNRNAKAGGGEAPGGEAPGGEAPGGEAPAPVV